MWEGQYGNVDQAVEIAQTTWPKWAALSLNERLKRIRAVAGRLSVEGEKFVDLISRETGKPLWEARIEVESLTRTIQESVRSFAERTPQRLLNGKQFERQALRHKPHGVMAVLGPFSSPAAAPHGHIIPALIAGNTVVFKPSELTPATGEQLVRLYRLAGIPEGVVELVQGDNETGAKLAAHGDIAGILFTGSAGAGISINRQFASQPNKLLSLQMGGNNPIIAWDTKNIHAMAAVIIQSAFLSAGQKCTNARRLILTDDMFEILMPEVKKLADRLIISEPHGDPVPFMGPVIDNQSADGLVESFLALMSHGGRPIRHMKSPVKNRPFITPGIIDVTDVKDRPDIELFGPLLQVIRVNSFEDAIKEANNTRFGLSASLLGGSDEQFDQFWANSRAGIVNRNTATNSEINGAPIGGIGLSGNNRPSGFYAADYCGYPVISTEKAELKAMIGVGMRDEMENIMSPEVKKNIANNAALVSA
ncbi:N-succinylglutamate 5-semialdehyde dehydrogenase [Sphingorhabdus lutea]|uniref:L-glutamate gamma-semialdehyde dehydrogenase n=2 Tax=Sphingorhabdus lutea TaxID=1913578 RepID=A0A1L3JBB9_9SPHN|nr:N-succinylglutamate 5-semialdehyde dehydrogenase [Sphingorhabdus lutea]